MSATLRQKFSQELAGRFSYDAAFNFALVGAGLAAIVPYETDMLFTEDGKSYWLVVSTEFLPKFQQQLKKGEAVDLFLVKLGNTRISDKLEPVLLVEKFSKP